MRLKSIPYRWWIVVLVFLLSVVNYLDRQTLSVLAPVLREKLGFSAVQYSYIVSAFLLAYTVGGLVCGSLVQRWGVRATVAAALLVWSAAGICHALVAGWVGLLVLRFILGLAESFNTPCGTQAISEWVPPSERGLSMAVFSNGYIIGAVLAPPLVAYVSVRYGWQCGFVVTGSAGLAFLLGWLAWYRNPRAAERPARSDGPAQGRISILAALRHPACLAFVLARLFTDSLSYFLTFWLPQYLHQSRGFTLAMIGAFAWMPFLAADVGGPGGGALSDWLVRRGWEVAAARRRLLLTAACVMPLSLVAVRTGSPALALVLIGAMLAAQSCWNSNLLALMSETFRSEHLATFVALSGFGGGIGGILSTLLAGRIVHSLGFGPIFTGLGFLHLIAYAILRRRARPARILSPA